VPESLPRGEVEDGRDRLVDFDVSVANPARMWNYWVGGKDHFAADRKAADTVLEVLPSMPVLARLTRSFLISAVHQLAADCGIRQFLDIGTGLPTADNTHDVAQRAAPESRVVYVDNDPVVLSHARALLTSSAEGKTDYLDADLRDTGKILAGAARTLDLRQPVAVLLVAVLHFIPDADDPYGVVARLMDAVPPGSYLVLSHGASDIKPKAVAEMMRRYNGLSSATLTLRSRAQVARFFDGLDLTGPGMVPIAQWGHPGQAADSADSGMAGYCGIAKKR
jgi:S-adenosyl methyltransferase